MVGTFQAIRVTIISHISSAIDRSSKQVVAEYLLQLYEMYLLLSLSRMFTVGCDYDPVVDALAK